MAVVVPVLHANGLWPVGHKKLKYTAALQPSILWGWITVLTITVLLLAKLQSTAPFVQKLRPFLGMHLNVSLLH